MTKRPAVYMSGEESIAKTARIDDEEICRNPVEERNDFKMSELKSLLGCNICSFLLRHPVQVNPCKHVFCNSCISKWIIRRHLCPYCKSRPKQLQQEHAISNIVDFVREYKITSQFGLEDNEDVRTCELVQEEAVSISSLYSVYEVLFWFYNQSRRRQRGIGPEFVTELRLLSQFNHSGRGEELMASVEIDIKHLPISNDREGEANLKISKFFCRLHQQSSSSISNWQPPYREESHHQVRYTCQQGSIVKFQFGKNSYAIAPEDLPDTPTVLCCKNNWLVFNSR